ncbi:MAG: helix-turn-helix domain-containing protein [Prevotella sp.]|nr:helix-turn-helix domain-containing protein [Prevotella sp.]
MNRLKNILLIIAILMLPCTVSADYVFKTLDARNGLTSSQINCIMKDSRGFMWFGTPAGLYRYDGYQFKHFQCDSQDGSSLPDSYIESIQESRDGKLWVKTAASYCVYDPQQETFERDMHQLFTRIGLRDVPQVIYIDRHKNLWGYIPNKGVICYNIQQQLQYEFTYSNNGIAEGNICSIGECKDGAILVYDNGLMICCNVSPQQYIVWTNKDIASQQLRKTKTLKVFADQMDNLWLYGQGTLFVYNKRIGKWDTTIGHSLGLTGQSGDHAVYAMGGDHNGNVWMGTSRNGLIRTNVNTYEMEQVPLKTMNTLRFPNTNAGILSIYIDNTDLLWTGTAKSGVAYMGNNIYKFESKIIGDITAMAQDSTGQIWYGTSDFGLYGHDTPLASQKVSALACTKDGSLWVGSKRNGLTRIKNGTSQIYSTARDSTRRTMINDHINALAVDKTGNLWIATDGGLQVYNARLDQFSNYTKENGKIRYNKITSLFYANGNKMLIGTSDGLIIMNISTTEMTYLVGNTTSLKKFTNNYITQVYEDSRGLIWVGTREGVNVLNLENDVLDHLTERQGLCNNNICGIAEDSNHNMWITTSNGICRIIVQRNVGDGSYDYGLYNYNHNDGLQSDEFNPGSILIDKEGKVIMGGLYGINWVRPKSEDEKKNLPRVMLTQLFIGEEEVFVGHSYDGNVILPTALNESSRIILNNDQNTFTIKFAAGNYNQSERLLFMYQLEGFDNNWHNGDALKHGVTFTDLPSGTYRLLVKAISVEGAISDQERIIEITINRPWYLQWWMLAIYALIIVLILYLWKVGFDQIRRFRKQKNDIVTELKRQREEIKLASDDLRQPMSRMTSIIMNLSERESTLEEREQLNALHTQMLQVITRVSDMQASLDHPEEKAEQNVRKQYMLSNKNEMSLSDMVNHELTSEIRPFQQDSPTSKFRVVFIDDNTDFVKFVTSRLKYVYEFHPYDNIRKAAIDIETMLPDLIICKQDMPDFTGSELCNNIKMHPTLNRIKFVLMTNTRLNSKDMLDQNITMGADDYLVKPFNLQEAVMRFNKLLGIDSVEVNNHLIEGAETRMLEGHNSSMTTATETMSNPLQTLKADEVVQDDQVKMVTITSKRHNDSSSGLEDKQSYSQQFSMADEIDIQLINSIEQYVQQNMSRGTINLEEMASAMGMSTKPFFQKVRDITGKTPSEVVRDLRLKHACVLLQRTNINMSELATHVGFVTGEHFINIFKDRFGISPTEYRLKYRQ